LQIRDKWPSKYFTNSDPFVRFFDKSKLSPRGFFVDIDDNDLTLPDGTIVSSGLDFRNNFHLNPLSVADIFVPCGGRPGSKFRTSFSYFAESVNLNNVNMLLDEQTKKPRFKVIIEGANLFFTNDSRRFLEERGVVLYKDASANKGGVTSSSLEVLAALSLSDGEFEEHMTVKGEIPPPFYSAYVVEVQQKIEENANLEFECIWKEHEKSKISRYFSENSANIFIEAN
jgi:glutamate dehydrogenase